jgi:hypothetical protein
VARSWVMAAVTSDLLALGNPERIRRAVPGAEVQWAITLRSTGKG